MDNTEDTVLSVLKSGLDIKRLAMQIVSEYNSTMVKTHNSNYSVLGILRVHLYICIDTYIRFIDI